MNEIYYSTGNSGKFKEVSSYLSKNEPDINLKQLDQDLIEIQTDDQTEIAIYKAKQAWEILKQPVLVDDAGFYVKKYKNFPGTLSKFVYQGLGFEGMFKLFAHNDPAQFVVVLVYIYGPGKYRVFEHSSEGRVFIPAGEMHLDPKLPYLSIFSPEGFDKSYSQLRAIQDDSILNPRIHALKAFLNWYKTK